MPEMRNEDEMEHHFIHVAGGNPEHIPLTIHLKEVGMRVNLTRIAEFPGYKKFSVAYGNGEEKTFRYFELYQA